MFRCSTFRAFSLYEQATLLKVIHNRFDAQCFELFLYNFFISEKVFNLQGFDAQCFELFLYNFLKILSTEKRGCFDAQCFELFLYIESDA